MIGDSMTELENFIVTGILIFGVTLILILLSLGLNKYIKERRIERYLSEKRKHTTLDT